MNSFDSTILLWLNQFFGRSAAIDGFIKEVSDNVLVQGAVPVTVLSYLWFRGKTPVDRSDDREKILITLAAAISAVFFARWIAILLPYRQRPMNEAASGFNNAYPEWGHDLYLWSSFPSDHAVLFFALATGIAVMSRPLGVAMFLHAVVIDCMPRIYLGFHHPTDILAGAFIGVAVTVAMLAAPFNRTWPRYLLTWSEERTGLFYAALWLLIAQVATMFDSAIEALQMFAHIAKNIYH